MDDCGPRNTEHFEEMEVSKFKWMLGNVCCGDLALKKASKSLAIHGIILSLIFMVLGVVGCYFVSTGFRSVLFFGLSTLMAGTVLLIYNLILLSGVRDNHAARVFKTIQVGCLILLYLQLITKLIISVGVVSLLAGLLRYQIITVFLVLLDLFLTALVIYAIHSAKPKIVSLYVYNIAIICIIIASLVIISLILILIVVFYGDDIGGFLAIVRGVGAVIFLLFPNQTMILIIILLFVVIFVGSIMSYYLKIFALFLNIITSNPVTNNRHRQKQIMNP